jgi:hypothetical protein
MLGDMTVVRTVRRKKRDMLHIDLSPRIAVVTGASGQLGRVMARCPGYLLYLCDK